MPNTSSLKQDIYLEITLNLSVNNMCKFKKKSVFCGIKMYWYDCFTKLQCNFRFPQFFKNAREEFGRSKFHIDFCFNF